MPVIPSIKQVHESTFRACSICVYEYIIEGEGTGMYRTQVKTDDGLTLPSPWIEPDTGMTEVIRQCEKVIDDFCNMEIENEYTFTAALNYYMQYDYEEKTYFNNSDMVKHILSNYKHKE